MHPLAEDISKLKDTEVEQKISNLSRKFFMTNNPSVQEQITLMLDMYRSELIIRRNKALADEYQKRDKDLDNLININ
jgi:hypothetical protein